MESRPTISPRNPSGTTSARPRPARDSLEPAWFPELLEIRGRLFRFARSGSFRLGGLTVGLHLGGPFLAQGVDEDTAGIVVEGDSLAELRSMVGEALELLDEDDLDSERDQLPAPWLGGRWA